MCFPANELTRDVFDVICLRLFYYVRHYQASVSSGSGGAHLSEVLEDVVQDDVLGLVGVHPGEGVHVDHCVLEAHQRDPQDALQSLRGGGGGGNTTHTEGEKPAR